MCVLHWFNQRASACPDALAIAFGDRRVTYQELNWMADQIAEGLREAGVTAGCLVGVILDRSPEMVAGLLGIWKAGGAYIPLDPAACDDRIAFMLEDAAPPVVLTHKKYFPRVRKGALLDLDELCSRHARGTSRSSTPSADNLAYVIYTSGSTGKPKGAAITHGGLANTVQAIGEDLTLGQDDVVLAWSTIAFDVACLELYLPLVFGACLYLVDKDLVSNGGPRIEQVRTSGATVMFGTPTMYRLLLEQGWRGDLRMQAVVGGEVLPLKLGTSLARICRTVWNQYGPSEAAICTTRAKIGGDAEKITIGRPLPNVSVHLLDEHLQPVPRGSTGEVYIGGVGVAAGYLNRADLNRMRFLPGPLGSGRLFKSGDLAIELADGSFDFLGRNDDQVKIRGFRIELGEIESALRQCEGVHAAVVRAIELGEGDRRLVAFVIGEETLLGRWRQALRRDLPAYMMPSEFVFLGSFPYTASGKVDVLALEALRLKPASSRPAGEANPADPVEAGMKEIWDRLLKISGVGLDEDFFALGGHSLLAARMLAQVEERFGAKLPHASLVEHPTIRGLAACLRESPVEKWPALVAIRAGGFLPPLFIAHGIGGSLLSFVELAAELGPQQPVYGLQLPASMDEPEAKVRTLAANYVKQVRAIQPSGPYHLAGHSSGGVVVFEMACQLTEQGETVDLLALLDCDPNTGKLVRRPFDDWDSFKASLGRAVAELRVREFGIKELLRRRIVYQKIKIGSWMVERSRRGGRTHSALPDSALRAEGYLALAMRDFELRAYAGNATLIIAQDEPGCGADLEKAWAGKILGECETHRIPGTHSTMLSRPQVSSLAREIRQRLGRNAQSATRRVGA
jgi:amino acid adenylation domain-containing protein